MRLDTGRLAIALDLTGGDVTLRLPPLARVLALKREVSFPFTAIDDVEVARAEWPHPFAIRLGTHVPWRVAMGTFYGWMGRRFLYQSVGDKVLRFRLRGHPYRTVEVVVPEPEALLKQVRAKMG